jgi:hypothetical protein
MAGTDAASKILFCKRYCFVKGRKVIAWCYAKFATLTDVVAHQKALSVNLGLAPGAQIEGVQGDAEYIRWNKAELGCAKSNEADYDAIDGRQNPALPTPSPY